MNVTIIRSTKVLHAFVYPYSYTKFFCTIFRFHSFSFKPSLLHLPCLLALVYHIKDTVVSFREFSLSFFPGWLCFALPRVLLLVFTTITIEQT